MTNGEVKELAAGNQSTIAESFVMIARDAKTYAALRHAVNQLPEQGADFFKSNAVVAAFLGQRRTGGYGVEIKREGESGLSISEHAPPKGGMVQMVLSAPFRVVSAPVGIDEPLALTLDTTWRERLRPYQVTGGALTVTGGFGGRSEQTQLSGSLGVMRAGELATFVFDVQSTGGYRPRHLRDAASGTVAGDGSVIITRLDAFAISGATESPFRATGQFTDKEQNLTLNFETIPAPHVSDNFSATGRFSAVTTAPPPINKAITGDERE